ncbi:MAG: hypothetical protein AABX66_03840 [Nanoarchaeota archaeon]
MDIVGDSSKKMVKLLGDKIFSVIILVLVFSVYLTFLSGSASAILGANFTNTTGGIERALAGVDSANLINFTVGAMSENITQVVFIVSGSQNFDPDKFIVNSNGTSAFASYFSNSSTSIGGYGGTHSEIITFTNLTSNGIIVNGSTKNFWFNINSRSQAASMITVVVNATGISGTSNQTNTLSFGFTFRFSGYVKNETGGLQNATNVSIWRWQEGTMGPPTETLVSQTKTGITGNFTLSGLSTAGGVMYKLKMIYYNESNPSQALKIGTILPQFPAEMFYPQVFSEEDRPQFAFMRPPSLNGTTFYLGPAATINVSANNVTATQRFGYMLMEQGTGFMIDGNSQTNVTNAQIIVPIARTYTLMVMRSNQQFSQRAICDGRFMNDTSCPTPPKANSSLTPIISGEIINVNISLAVSRVQLYGCINVAGNSSPITNISAIMPRMTPWTGFVPPAPADNRDLNISSALQLNYSDSRCSGKFAWYNISLLDNNYLVEFYGRNDSVGAGSEYVGAFQNVSFDGQTAGTNNYINITLNRLAGNFKVASGQTETNTTKFAVRIQNSTGGAITQDTPHIEFQVRNNIFGTLTYVADNIVNGTFYLALPLNSTGKIKVFSNNAPPKEKVVNFSSGEINLTLTTMSGGDAGFKRINASGRMESMNITDSSFGMNMNFFRAGGICDVASPSAECNITSMGATSFNPFSAMVAGKINMQMKMASSGVGITFYNFDMFAAKQPPMESIMDNNALSGGSSASQVWQFGSFVPADVYDYAIVSIPYSDSVINDSANVNMSIPYLYDENWNVAWNSSRGDSTSNLTSDIDDYIGSTNNRSFNATGYRSFLQAGGIVCNKTNSSITGDSPSVYCYINTSANMIYMRVPHFSGVSPYITGSAPDSASTSSTTTSSASGGGTLSNYWSLTYTNNDQEFSTKGEVKQDLLVKERTSIKISGVTHYIGIVALQNGKATVNVSSEPQQAILGVGESAKFELTNDSYYDIKVTLTGINSITNKASLSIVYVHEIIDPISASGLYNRTEQQNQTESSSDTQKSNKTRNVVIIVIIALIVLIVLLGIIFFRKENIKSKVKVSMDSKSIKVR